MKIVEKLTNVECNGAKISGSDRPDGLVDWLNFVNITLIIGLPASGKSSLIQTLLNGTNTHRLYNNIFHSVYYISPSDTININIPDEKNINLTEKDVVSVLEEIIENESDLGEEDEHHNVLIILDDAINWIMGGGNRAKRLFGKLAFNGRHILGKYSSVATWVVSQRIKSIPKYIRSMANQIFFFDSTKNEKQILQEEFMLTNKKETELLFNHIYDKKFNFLFINLNLPKESRYFKNFNRLYLENLDTSL